MSSVDEIKALLKKNKKRLAKELEQSKEAVALIKKSMHSDLTDEEKDKVKDQLLDICKAVPAFAVFMLPGGALLLPLLMKLIPDILPSSFREDDDEKDTTQELIEE